MIADVLISLADTLADMDWLSIFAGALVGAFVALVITSLFQEGVDSALFRVRARLGRSSVDLPTTAGIWLSRYRYESADHPEPKVSEHYLIVEQSGHRVRGASLPKTEGSALTLDLRLEGSTLTGEWREWTSKERLYRGAVQFRLNETRDGMEGAWVGFTRGSAFRTGPWTLERMTRDTGRRSRRKYSRRRDLA